jgi:hypothetical protein
MMKPLNIYYSSLLLLTSLLVSINSSFANPSGDDDYYGNTAIRYEDYIYKPNIKTVRFYDENFELSQPMLRLGSEEKLKF